MLYLLRNIRRKLLTDNKVTTYLPYAIGEIVLVVVGILIAVNIDNWNEDRQVREMELAYLKNLQNDLQSDTTRLSIIISLINEKSTATQRMNERSRHKSIENIYHFSNDMLSILWDETFTPNTNTYNEMVSTGKLSIIRNEELKLSLLNLNQHYSEITYNQEHMQRVYADLLVKPFTENLVWSVYYDMGKFRATQQLALDSTYIDQNQQLLLTEADALLRNKPFQNGLLFYEIDNALILSFYKEAKKQAVTMMEKIDQEINN